MFKVNLGKFLFKHRPNKLLLLGYEDANGHHGSIRMGLSALNVQREGYGFIDDSKCVICAAKPRRRNTLFYKLSLFPYLAIPVQQLVTCAREILDELFQITA